MHGPFDVLPVVAHLKNEVPALRQVGAGADFAAVANATVVATPSAFVLLASESASPQSGGSTLAIQKIEARFSVIVAVQSYRISERGAAQADQLRAIVGEIRDQLMGSKPPGLTPEVSTAVDLVSGGLLHYTPTVTWWQDVFRLSYWSRK